MTNKQRALNMRMTDNRQGVVRRPKKVAHLSSIDMEKRREGMGRKSTRDILDTHN